MMSSLRVAKKSKPNEEDPLILYATDIWAAGIFPFLGPGYFFFVALVSRRFKFLYELYFRNFLVPKSIPFVYGKWEYVELPKSSFTFSRRALAQANMDSARNDVNMDSARNDVIEHDVSSDLIQFDLPLKHKRMRAMKFHTFLTVAFSNESCFDCWHKSGEGRFVPCSPADVLDKITQQKYDKGAFMWALCRGYKWSSITPSCNLAARGDVETFQLALRKKMPTSPHTIISAAREGHDSLIEYAHSCEVQLTAGACAHAARYGKLETLKMLRRLGCPWDERVIVEGAVSGNVRQFEWYAQQEGSYGVTLHMHHMWPVIEHGHLQFLEFLERMGFQFDSPILMNWAAQYGKLDVVKFLKAQGIPLRPAVMKNAVASGNPDVVEYMYDNDCPVRFTYKSDGLAAERGYLDILKYLHEKNHPWSPDTLYRAANGGQLETFKYAHENGCQWHSGALAVAARRGHAAILEYASSKVKVLQGGVK